MKILLSALACDPGKGSELEVGFRALLAAASRHEVWVLTNSATIPIVRRAIQEYPWADRVHFEGIYFDVDDELYPQLQYPWLPFVLRPLAARGRSTRRGT